MWDGDYYYLRGYCDERQAMRTFRLDRIEKQPDILRDPAVPKPENYSIAEYSKSVFRMYDTDEPQEVTLLCKTSTMKVLIDNFGLDVDTTPVDEDHFQAKGEFKVACPKCRVVMVRTPKGRRRDTIELYAPKGQKHVPTI